MRVISIDPGYDRCGVAVIEKTRTEKEKLVFSTCIQTNSKQDFLTRFFEVLSSIELFVEKYQPQYMALEQVYFSNNKNTAMHIAEIRGGLMFMAQKHQIKISELNPLQIKLAVTGDGKSDKSQVIKMIQLILGFREKVKDDEYDAIAVGLAFFALQKTLL